MNYVKLCYIQNMRKKIKKYLHKLKKQEKRREMKSFQTKLPGEYFSEQVGVWRVEVIDEVEDKSRKWSRLV